MIGQKFECTCDSCKAACSRKPGWFLPKEVEKAAKHMELSLQEFFNQYLGVDWWVRDSPIFILAPALIGEDPGTEYPGDPQGKCVFFNAEELCNIHPVKPYECAQLTCHEDKSSDRHEKVAMAWKDHQPQIIKLLGRKPIETEYFGGFAGLFGLGSF